MEVWDVKNGGAHAENHTQIASLHCRLPKIIFWNLLDSFGAALADSSTCSYTQAQREVVKLTNCHHPKP
jgi:hypothetical protein